ncbi:hypothetical protein M2337_002739 [Sphingobium sp. B2D3A]|uniref:hypothetical protein n=1 Tax=unclassified Sphingobium TaxID=2611147 RepID=UPI002224BB37|nr:MULTISPECIES: hypothetical protein [unclassified Sphingobium]MCW2338506.1 hypothetical protein [Sphingobium sp. B2D3A]MCW2384964.1 hypothetical protein [Sphingobium sp. B2D3D]
MKIQVLVRSADWLQSAGTRIRYRRLQPYFSQLGYSFEIDTISSIREGLKLNADVYLFSKCTDAGALMLADMLREAGALVGFDLFDDYVSGQSSATFSQRHFQRALNGRADFLLCSTERMSTVVKRINPAVPTHVLNDPFRTISRERLLQLIESKIRQVRQTGRLNVLWFGQGSNPLFPVGISDLVAFSDALAPLKHTGLDVHLKVLTNTAALDAQGLETLQNLPYWVEVVEWSAQAEEASLDEAVLAFLPVNYQSFSVAKSLNRAVTALTHGAQILTVGHPLYAALADFVYSNAADFSTDLKADSMKLRGATLVNLQQCLGAIADPAQETSRFLTFLAELPIGTVEIPVDQRPFRAIIHGAASSPAIHTLGRSLGWLSLASPFARQTLPFSAQIGYFDGGSTLQLRLMRTTLARLSGEWSNRAVPLPKVDYGEYSHVLPLPDNPQGRLLNTLAPQMIDTKAGRIIFYESVMAATETIFREIFGDILMMRSEMEMPLPGVASISGSIA